MSRTTVQSMWIGRRLSAMEQLSIRSYVANGHEFHLYTYGPVAGVPDGTTVRPASELIPEAEIFRYRRGRGRGSVSAFSNCFRYRLLLGRGGWWADLDTVCLAPLEFAEAHVVGRERAPGGGTLVGSALVKAPAGSRLMARCWEASAAADRSRVTWGEIGPQLLSRAVAETGAEIPVRILAPELFYPVDFWRVWDLLGPTDLPDGCLAVHLWNSGWRQQLLDPDAEYDSRSLYERLKRRYGLTAPAGAARGPGWRAAALRRLRRWKLAALARGLPRR